LQSAPDVIAALDAVAAGAPLPFSRRPQPSLPVTIAGAAPPSVPPPRNAPVQRDEPPRALPPIPRPARLPSMSSAPPSSELPYVPKLARAPAPARHQLPRWLRIAIVMLALAALVPVALAAARIVQMRRPRPATLAAAIAPAARTHADAALKSVG